MQTWETSAKPESQNNVAKIDCSMEKRFIHENLETDGNTDSSGKTGNSKCIIVLNEVNQMAEMTKFMTNVDEEVDKWQRWCEKQNSGRRNEQQNQGGG